MITNRPNPPQQAPDAAQSPEQQQASGGKASEGQNKQLKQLVEAALMIIHSEKSGASIHKAVVSAQDPIEGIAKATMTILRRIEVKAKKVDDAVRMELARQILNELTKLSITAGILTKEQLTPEFIKALIGKVMQLYLSNRASSGQLGKKQLSSMVESGRKYAGQNPDKFADMTDLMGQQEG